VGPAGREASASRGRAGGWQAGWFGQGWGWQAARGWTGAEGVARLRMGQAVRGVGVGGSAPGARGAPAEGAG